MSLKVHSLTYGSNGVIISDHAALPLVANFVNLCEFVAAVERSGANIYPGMPHSELNSLYSLWYDAFQR